MPRLLLAVGCCALVAAVHAQPTRDYRQELATALKTFFAAPSLQGFVDLASPMSSAVMTPERWRLEDETGKPQRPPHADFEAVKARLAAGVVVQGPVTSRSDSAGDILQGPLGKGVARAPLPDVTPSFFGGSEPFVVPLRPFTLADQFVSLADALSAFHRTELRMRVMGPAQMRTHGVYGVWDVGSIGITFARPVRIHGLAADGSPTGADISSMRADFTTYCGDKALSAINARSINAGWRGAVVAWVGKAPVGVASMSTRQINGATQYDKLVIDTIDIDRDGVPDFSIWSGMQEAVASTDTFWRAVFGNIGGEWVLLGFAQEADCT